MKQFVLLFSACCALPVAAQQISIVSGQGQLVFEQFRSNPMVVRVTDANGTPMAGQPVTWAAPAGQVSLNVLSERTDAQGLASATVTGTSLQIGLSQLPLTITATAGPSTATFYVTTVLFAGGQGATANLTNDSPTTISGAAGAVVPAAFSLQVATAAGFLAGRPIPNVAVRTGIPEGSDPLTYPTGTCDAPGGVVLTNENGIATCNLRLNEVAGNGRLMLIRGDVLFREIPLEIRAAQRCLITFTGTASNNFTAAAGAGQINFTSNSTNCVWTANSNASWLTLEQPVSGTGAGRVSYRVEANTGAGRTGVITIAGRDYQITQAGSGSTGTLVFTGNTQLRNAVLNQAYSETLAVAGGTPPYTWTATGSLPAGISLNSSTGVLSGTFSTAGTYQIPVTARDAAGNTVTQTFTVSATATGAPDFAFAVTNFPPAVLNASYSHTVALVGACQNPFNPGRIELTAGSLPPGVAFTSPSSGVYTIAGTPTATGTFAFSLRATDACGKTVTRDFTMLVAESGTPSARVQMTVTPASLAFTMTRGGSAPAEQQISAGTGDARIPFTATATSETGWLSLGKGSGTTPDVISVRITDAAALQEGTYNGSISIASAATNSPVAVPVRLTVTSTTPTQPSLPAVVSPASLRFVYSSGGTVPSPQSLSVASTAGSAAFPFTTTVQGGTWLSVSPSAGTTPATLQVSVSPTSLAPATYSGTITITGVGGTPPVVVPVALTVNGRPTPAISAVVNGASFQPGPIAPGEIVTIRGSNLGPATLTEFRLTPSGNIDTTLDTVRVWFNETQAPILHAVEGQVTVIAPYTLAGMRNARVQIEYRSVVSEAREISVAESAPGLFMAGAGPAGAILNEDSSYNTAQNAARPGTIIQLFGTGEGQTNPAGTAGGIVSATNPARPVLPVSVTIGGRQAEVVYAGSVAGQIFGLLQVNARIPESTPAGAVPVELTIGASGSQTVNVYVRQ